MYTCIICKFQCVKETLFWVILSVLFSLSVGWEFWWFITFPRVQHSPSVCASGCTLKKKELEENQSVPMSFQELCQLGATTCLHCLWRSLGAMILSRGLVSRIIRQWCQSRVIRMINQNDSVVWLSKSTILCHSFIRKKCPICLGTADLWVYRLT